LLIALRPAGRARRQGAAEGTTGKKMKCYAHPDAEAVAICVQCGKGICPDCAGKTASGTYVCSATCARGRAARPDALNGYFLYSLGAVLGAAAVFYFVQGPWQMSVFLALAAFFSYLRGTRSQLNGSGRTELYYRIGDAMEKTHRFRQCLAELLTLHAKLSDAPMNREKPKGWSRFMVKFRGRPARSFSRGICKRRHKETRRIFSSANCWLRIISKSTQHN